MDSLFPRESVHRRCTVIADLKMSLGIKEQILRLYIPMGHTLTVQVPDSIKYLLEAALDFTRGHPPFLDGGVQVPTRAKLHHFTPFLLFVLDEINCLDDVDVVESGGYTEFGGEFLDVFFFCFIFAAFSEFFDGV